MKVTVIRKHWPVGHGGFATGSLAVNELTFKYIYDCGSMKSDVIKREVGRWCEECGTEVDALFVSHMDRDHINGLDYLLNRVTTKTVYLPYLTDLDTFLLGADLLADNDMSVHCTSFLADPGAWLKSRGVTEVVGVMRKRHGDKIAEPLSPKDLLLQSPLNSRPNDDRETIDHKNQDDEGKDNSQKTYDRIIPTESYEAFVTIPSEGMPEIFWVLAPFVPPLGDLSKISFLIKDIKLEFGVDCGEEDLNSQALVNILSKSSNHTKVKKIYSKYIKDVNKASMCLYSGPLPDMQHHTVHWSAAFQKSEMCLLTDDTECGWIGTGDYDLKSSAAIALFTEHYSDLKSKIVTFMVPHHGSINNFSEEAVKDFSPKLFFVNCPTGSKKHPHTSTLNILKKTGQPLARIQESKTSKMVEKITITVPSANGAPSTFSSLTLSQAKKKKRV